MTDPLINRISITSDILAEGDLSDLPTGLLYGKVGLALYFYYLSQVSDQKKHNVLANKILENAIGNLSSKSVGVDFENGLSGIAWAIAHLVSNGFTSGNINTILNDIDDKIFQITNFYWLSDSKADKLSILKLLIYYLDRVKYFKKNDYSRNIYQDMIISFVNKLYNEMVCEDFAEPLFFSLDYTLPLYLIVLSKVYEQNYFNYKLQKILDVITPIVVTALPYYQSNRLYLAVGIQSIINNICIPKWEEHVNLLLNSIDHSYIISNEFKNRNININNGVTGYAILLNIMDKYRRGNLLVMNKKSIKKKILDSYCWEEEYGLNLVNKNIGLYTGFAGVALTSLTILK